MHSSLLRDMSESDAFSPLRLHLLATLLSLSPSRLLLYVAAAHGPRLVSEPSREFSPLMHAILLALMLPFSTPDAIAEQSAAASPQQQQSRKGTPRDSTAERPSLLEPHEHFESMRSVVVPSRASSEESHGSCIYNDSSSSNCWSESPSLRSYSADEAPEHEQAEPKKHKKTEKRRVSLRREFSPERSATQLLRDLAEPLLHARPAVAHSIGRRIGSSSSSSSSSRKAFVMASRSEGQQSMQLLPRELHSAAGVARLTNLCPPFVPLLLEALLKESVRSDVFGLAARYSFLRLIELSAPLFIAPHSAVLTRATQRLVTAAVAALNVLEDSNWALEFIGALIAVHLVHPSALRAQLERRAADLAKAPTNWRPFVALAYCAVTEQSLGLSLSAAVAEREGTAATQMVTLLDEAAKTDGDDNENENNNNDDGGGGGVEEEEPQQSPDAVRGLSETHVSVADTSLADASVSFSGSPPFLSPFGRAASPSLPAEISADMAAVPQWTFPARLPPAVTLPAVTVMTCMVLCRRNVNKRAVVAIGLWCLRAIVELPATPCAVALTHLMLKYPAYFTDVTVRGGSGSGLGMGRGGEASQTTFAQTQLPMVQSWTAAASTSIRFWDAAAIEACRLAEAALRRYARQRADERLATETKPSASNNKEVEEEKHEEEKEGRGEVPEQKPDDAVLDDLHDAQCYLMLLLEAVALRRGVLFSSAAQDALASLFACAARLRIAAGPFLSSPPRSALQSRAVVLCDEAFRAVARAVDIVLHDYAAGYPRQLCDALAAIGPHSNSNSSSSSNSNISAGNVSGPFAAGLRRAGAWDRHADCLETIAAAAAYAASGARRVGDFADTTAAQEPAAAKGRAAVEPAPAPRSLVGELPCSGEPLRLGAQDSGGGGLAAAQRQWWARRTVTFLVEQWWRAHGVAVVRCRPDTDGKSYLECCPHAI